MTSDDRNNTSEASCPSCTPGGDASSEANRQCRCSIACWVWTVAIVLLVAGTATTVYFYWRAKRIESTYDPSPLPRPLVDAPFIATPHDVVDQILELAEVGPGDVVYDLGCGDGRIVIAAARRYGCRGVGIDKDPERIRQSQANAKREGVEDLVEFIEADIFTIDLRPASVVTLYLLPQLNLKLVPQLRQLKPGSRIVSHDFDLGTIKPDRTVYFTSKEDEREHTLHLWRTPLAVPPENASAGHPSSNRR